MVNKIPANAHKKPVIIKTTGTILPTSTPIRVAVSGFSAILRNARPKRVLFNRRLNPKTSNIDKPKLINWGIPKIIPPILNWA